MCPKERRGRRRSSGCHSPTFLLAMDPAKIPRILIGWLGSFASPGFLAQRNLGRGFLIVNTSEMMGPARGGNAHVPYRCTMYISVARLTAPCGRTPAT